MFSSHKSADRCGMALSWKKGGALRKILGIGRCSPQRARYGPSTLKINGAVLNGDFGVSIFATFNSNGALGLMFRFQRNKTIVLCQIKVSVEAEIRNCGAHACDLIYGEFRCNYDSRSFW